MHKLHLRGCRSSWRWPQPLLLQTTHLYPSPCWPEDKRQVNPGAPAPLLFSLSTREEENRVANSEFLPAGGWDTTYLTATSHVQACGIWRHGWSICLQGGCSSAAWLPEHAGGEVGTNLNFPLHLDKGKQELSQEIHFITYNFHFLFQHQLQSSRLHFPCVWESFTFLVFLCLLYYLSSARWPPHHNMFLIYSLQGSCEADIVSLPMAGGLNKILFKVSCSWYSSNQNHSLILWYAFSAPDFSFAMFWNKKLEDNCQRK